MVNNFDFARSLVFDETQNYASAVPSILTTPSSVWLFSSFQIGQLISSAIFHDMKKPYSFTLREFSLVLRITENLPEYIYIYWIILYWRFWRKLTFHFLHCSFLPWWIQLKSRCFLKTSRMSKRDCCITRYLPIFLCLTSFRMRLTLYPSSVLWSWAKKKALNKDMKFSVCLSLEILLSPFPICYKKTKTWLHFNQTLSGNFSWKSLLIPQTRSANTDINMCLCKH